MTDSPLSGFEIQEALSSVARRLYAQGMTTATGGNVSAREENGRIWITPASMDKGALKAGDMVCVDGEGRVSEGRRPSSELPLHQAIYMSRPGIGAVIHAHSPALVAFSLLHKLPRTEISDLYFEICGIPAFAPYMAPGSSDLGRVTGSLFSDGTMCVVMANHAAVVAGRDIEDAWMRFEALETCALINLECHAGGEVRLLSRSQLSEHSLHEPPPLPVDETLPYGDDGQAREELAQQVRRACVRRLIAGGIGVASVRRGEDDFLITPSRKTRWNLTGEDLVRVRNGMTGRAAVPSRAAMLHREIYLRNSGIRSVIMAQPPYLMTYAVSGLSMEVQTIPECWIYLRNMPLLPYDDYRHAPGMIADALAGTAASLLVENGFAIFTGETPHAALERLEVAEANARALRLAAAAGRVNTLDDNQTAHLGRIYPLR